MDELQQLILEKKGFVPMKDQTLQHFFVISAHEGSDESSSS